MRALIGRCSTDTRSRRLRCGRCLERFVVGVGVDQGFGKYALGVAQPVPLIEEMLGDRGVPDEQPVVQLGAQARGRPVGAAGPGGDEIAVGVGADQDLLCANAPGDVNRSTLLTSTPAASAFAITFGDRFPAAETY
jgi:hypothetical protein